MTSRLLKCHACEHRGPVVSHRCACTVNGQDITANAVAGKCPAGKFDGKPVGPDAVDPSLWPLPVRLMAKLRKPQDKGVGDTLARIVGPVGGDAFKATYKELTGGECGCADRQAKLNALYPFT